MNNLGREIYYRTVQGITDNKFLLHCYEFPSRFMKSWHVEVIKQVLTERGYYEK